MSASVVTVPQVSAARSLYPFNGWQSWYQGKSGLAQLMFSEGGVALDPMAGKSGYSEMLVAGCAVPLGSCVTLWLPIFRPKDEGSYVWVVSWRVRNLNDLAVAGKPAHNVAGPQSPAGFPVPAATNSVIYNSASPGSPTSPAVQNVYPEYFVSNAGTTSPQAGGLYLRRPFVPQDATGAALGSGAMDNGSSYTTEVMDGLPTYRIVELQAQGDEFTLGVYRSAGGKWDFVSPGGFELGPDEAFGNWITRGHGAVYVMYGVSA